MKKMVGYAISIAGIVVMALGFGVIPIKIALFEGVSANYITGIGIAAIIVGVIIGLRGEDSGRRKSQIEVPIYEGRGKKRRVVGYQRE